MSNLDIDDINIYGSLITFKRENRACFFEKGIREDNVLYPFIFLTIMHTRCLRITISLLNQEENVYTTYNICRCLYDMEN